jgi:limonene 1,2-monooxygenase
MRFGIFMAPFHPPAGQDPTSAVQRDLEVVQLLDRLGYEEAWIGEHHSAGTEIIPDPMIFIAFAAPQTRHIKLGTGVLSLPYHNPLLVADRAFFLDQLLRGRFMLGLGPGALPGDAAMLGISIEDQRSALEQDTEVLMHLLRSDDPITIETPRYKLVNAKSQYGPTTDFDIAVAAIASPTGPRVAGKHGLGLLSIGATTTAGFDLLAHHWDVWRSAPRSSARSPIGTSGVSSARCTSPRPESRPSKTSSTGSTTGVTTPRRSWPCPTSVRPARPSKSASPG